MEELQRHLGGLFTGLFAEVVTCDCYHLRSLDFVPDLVFDVGANVGVFSLHVRALFPQARIVALEPHPKSAGYWRQFFAEDDNAILVEKALGAGPVFHLSPPSPNLAQENFQTDCLGYSEKSLKSVWEATNIESIRLSDFILPHWQPGTKTVIKIDCEGGENSIWLHKPSMDMLREVDYITIELHYFAAHGGACYEAMKSATGKALLTLAETHNCFRDGVYLQARRRQ